jgi:tagatose 1,6-diphosphate aldolase
VRELGGTGGKIMVYLRADRPHANTHNMAIVRQCIEDFKREDLLLVVEFLTYRLPGEDAAAYKAIFPTLIEQGTRLCLDAGAKVLKLPFPGSAQACAAITAMCGPVPWSVLSAGVDHETFLGQVEIAMANGAAGVIAGRALWKDCVFLDRDRQRGALVNTAVPRLRQIQAILEQHPRPADGGRAVSGHRSDARARATGGCGRRHGHRRRRAGPGGLRPRPRPVRWLCRSLRPIPCRNVG